MTEYSEAQKKMLKATFELRLAQRDLEEAEAKWKTALDEVSRLEQQELPNYRDVRGILKRN
jgi:hypothetical protein